MIKSLHSAKHDFPEFNDCFSRSSGISNSLKPKLVYMSFKDSVRPSKRISHLTITKINWLMLFKEIIAVYT
jgi:hypothetical protein